MSFSKTAPVGPLASNSASRIATAEPCSGVRTPRKPWKSVATCPGAARFSLIGVSARLRVVNGNGVERGLGVGICHGGPADPCARFSNRSPLASHVVAAAFPPCYLALLCYARGSPLFIGGGDCLSLTAHRPRFPLRRRFLPRNAPQPRQSPGNCGPLRAAWLSSSPA